MTMRKLRVPEWLARAFAGALVLCLAAVPAYSAVQGFPPNDVGAAIHKVMPTGSAAIATNSAKTNIQGQTNPGEQTVPIGAMQTSANRADGATYLVPAAPRVPDNEQIQANANTIDVPKICSSSTAQNGAGCGASPNIVLSTGHSWSFGANSGPSNIPDVTSQVDG